MLAGIDHELPLQHLGDAQRVEGALIGGNYTALACMAGTRRLHAPARSILHQYVGELYYRLERSLWQLLESIDARQLGAIFAACSPIARARKSPTAWSGSPANTPPPSRCRSPPAQRVQAQNWAWPDGKIAVLEGNRLRW